MQLSDYDKSSSQIWHHGCINYNIKSSLNTPIPKGLSRLNTFGGIRLVTVVKTFYWFYGEAFLVDLSAKIKEYELVGAE